MGLLLTCCHIYAQNLVSVIPMNWKTEAVQVGFDRIQEGCIFKTDLNINRVFFSCRTFRGNCNESTWRLRKLTMGDGARSWWIFQQLKVMTGTCWSINPWEFLVKPFREKEEFIYSPPWCPRPSTAVWSMDCNEARVEAERIAGRVWKPFGQHMSQSALKGVSQCFICSMHRSIDVYSKGWTKHGLKTSGKSHPVNSLCP